MNATSYSFALLLLLQLAFFAQSVSRGPPGRGVVLGVEKRIFSYRGGAVQNENGDNPDPYGGDDDGDDDDDDEDADEGVDGEEEEEDEEEDEEDVEDADDDEGAVDSPDEIAGIDKAVLKRLLIMGGLTFLMQVLLPKPSVVAERQYEAAKKAREEAAAKESSLTETAQSDDAPASEEDADVLEVFEDDEDTDIGLDQLPA